MRAYIFLVPAFLWSVLAWAQDGYRITGQVLGENDRPLSEASVLNRASLEGTSTDSEGRFSLFIETLPAYLEVSFIGYDSHFRELTAENFEDGVLELSIRLKPRSEQLRPVLVEGKRYENFFTHSGFEVLDFAFVDEHTLLLLKYGREYKLALINEAEDSLMHLLLPRRASGFVKDCLQHVYLESGDSLYALRFAQEKIELIGALALDFYVEQVKPCVASNAYNLYYKLYKGSNQWVRTYQSPISGGKSRLIHATKPDLNDILYRQQYKRTALMLRYTDPKEGLEMISWYRHILNRPAYNPLFALHTGALLFDHLTDSLFMFDKEGNIGKQYRIKHHLNKHFKNEILRDAATGKLYVRYEKGGMTTLLSLSGEDYTTQERYLLKGYDFPVSLKIRNGIAYFLDYAQKDMDRLKLHRQRLVVDR